MDALLLTARGALAVVFVVAAVGKLADLAGFRRTLADFGVPRSLTAVGTIALPAAELATATLLLLTATARAGALAALALLVVFCIAAIRVLMRGERPDCNCFGRAHSRSVGMRTLARNGGFAALALLVVAGGAGAPLGEAFNDLDVSPLAILLGLGLIAQAWISWQLFRQHGRLLARVLALEAAAEELRPASLAVIHPQRPRVLAREERPSALAR